jgi:hypothetical protein
MRADFARPIFVLRYTLLRANLLEGIHGNRICHAQRKIGIVGTPAYHWVLMCGSG